MSVRSGDRWVAADGRMHRVDPASKQLFCGDPLDDESRILDPAGAWRIVAKTGMESCSRCRDEARTRKRAEEGIRVTPRALSPEQQAIRDRIDAENKRREQFRGETDRLQRSGGSSVRTVGGGLPGLGKRRR